MSHGLGSCKCAYNFNQVEVSIGLCDAQLTYHANGNASYLYGFHHKQLARTWTKFEVTAYWHVPGLLHTGKGHHCFRVNNVTKLSTFKSWFMENIWYSWSMSGTLYTIPIALVYLYLLFISNEELRVQTLEEQCPGSPLKHSSNWAGPWKMPNFSL